MKIYLPTENTTDKYHNNALMQVHGNINQKVNTSMNLLIGYTVQ